MYSLLGRSPSEAEFQLYLSQGQSGAFQPDAAHAALHTDADVTALRSPDAGLEKRSGSGMNGVLSRIGSIPRVASLDFWRDIVLKGTTSFSNLSAAVAATNPQPNPYSQPTAPAAEPSEQPKPNGRQTVERPVAMAPPPATRAARLRTTKAAEMPGATVGGSKAASAASTSTRQSARGAAASSAAATLARANKRSVVESPSVSGDDSDDDPASTQRALDAELLDENGKPKSLSKEEMRRVRRMISNRESARRSRRRKLEHVQCLDGQIQALQNQNTSLLGQLQTAEHRCHEAMLENARLKEELEALKAQCVTHSVKPLTRVLSQEQLAKRGRAFLNGGVALSSPMFTYDPAAHAVPHYVNAAAPRCR
jgi:hypothetical protein